METVNNGESLLKYSSKRSMVAGWQGETPMGIPAREIVNVSIHTVLPECVIFSITSLSMFINLIEVKRENYERSETK